MHTTLAPTAARSHREIPGPRGLALWSLLRPLTTRPHEVLAELAAKYGDLVVLDFPMDRNVLLGNPDDIEYVLHHRHQHYDKQTPRWRTLRQVWGQGLLTADRDDWRRQRQRMQPAFHQGGLQHFGAMVVEEAQEMGKVWADSARRGELREVDRDMLRCAVRAVTRAMFGADVENKTDVLIQAVLDINAYINPVSPSNLLSLPFPIRRWVSPGFVGYQRAMNEVRQIFAEIIDRRVRSQEHRPDLLGQIISSKDEELSETMTLQQLHDEMMGVLMAGHETTGIGTGWAWYWISQNPEVERKLHAEVDAVLGARTPTVEDLPKLEYTRMVFQEALRITPPVWCVDRRARDDDAIGGYRIPAGTCVLISPYVLHRHPKYWDNPGQFRPERFTEEESAKRPAYAYFPFGGGPRRCIGMRFAMMEGVLFLAVLSQSFSVRMKPDHPIALSPKVNLPAKFGLPMIVRERRPSEAPAAGRDVAQSA
jgi:cytochrome P450